MPMTATFFRFPTTPHLAWLAKNGMPRDDKVLSPVEAQALLSGNEHEVDSQHVLELVRDSDCSAYDCEFVSVAMRLGVKLLTADGKILKAFAQHTLGFAAA